MEKSDCVERLMLFNERAAELTSYSFAKMIGRLIFSNERVVGFTLSRRDGLLLFQRYGPERESIKSFVSAYRQFTLDTDRISIRNMSTIYGETWISQDKTNEFERQRTEINDILNSNFDVVINGETYTNKKIQDIFIYGDIIHIHACSVKKPIAPSTSLA
jgi:hypothetical protein